MFSQCVSSTTPHPPTCEHNDAKVRALLAKSRIELGQYERGLTDCGVASRLLDFEEQMLREREAEQVCVAPLKNLVWK